MKKVISIGDVEFHCEASKTDDGYKATVETLCCKGKESSISKYSVFGSSPDESFERLERKLKNNFALPFDNITPFQAAVGCFKWVCAGEGFLDRASRILGILILSIFISPFFIDYVSGTSSISKNLSGLLDAMNVPRSKPDAFLSEQFIHDRLGEAKYRFYASGVSFRNMFTANIGELKTVLGKNVNFKIVFLDPDSPLAEENFIRKFSRTATKADIENSIRKFTDGELEKQLDKHRHEVWISDAAPMVPMIIVDDKIYVSFLIHTSKDNLKNIYDGPYLVFTMKSEMGKVLLQHFDNLIDDEASRRVFPE